MANENENPQSEPQEQQSRFQSAHQRSLHRYNSISDDEARTKKLQEDLQRNLEILANSNGRDAKRAYKEIQATRELLEKQKLGNIIDADGVLERFDTVLEHSKHKAAKFDLAAKSMITAVREELPSFDNFISAMTMANPAVGMGVKALVAMRQEMRKKRSEEKTQHEKKLRQLAEEGKATEEQREELKKIDTEREKQKRGKGPLVERMDKLNSETRVQTGLLESLARAWDVGLTEIKEELQDTREQDKKQYEETETEEKIADGEKLEADSENKEQGPKLERVANGKDGKNGFGIFGGLGRLLGTGGLLGGLMAGLSAIGGLIMAALPFVAIAGAVFWGIYEIFDAIGDAGEILGKAKDELTSWDFISVAVGALAGMLGKIIDAFMGLFGVDTDYGESFKKETAKWLASIPEKIMSAFNFINDFIDGVFKDFGPKIHEYVKREWPTVYRFLSLGEGQTTEDGEYIPPGVVHQSEEDREIYNAHPYMWGGKIPDSYRKPLKDKVEDSEGTGVKRRFKDATDTSRALDASDKGNVRGDSVQVVNAPTSNNSTTHYHNNSRDSKNNETTFNALNKGSALYGH